MTAHDLIKNNKGVTLAEIMMATVLVGIVALGAVSVDFAMRSLKATTASDALVTAGTTVILEHILKNANLATGDSNFVGIDDDGAGDGGNANYLCFRTDDGGTFNTAGDDIWDCYSRIGNVIFHCEKDETAAQVPGVCANTDFWVGEVSFEADAFTFDFIINAGTGDLYLDLDIRSRADPTLGFDPLTNPEFAISTRIFPEGHSF